MRHSRIMFSLAVAGAFAAVLPLLSPEAETEKSKDATGRAIGSVVAHRETEIALAPPAPPTGFSPQSRRGFSAGDQWEPAIAADGRGTVYVLYPQYFGVPGCATCPSPSMVLQTSRDRGTTWNAPRVIAPPGTGQWDAQIAVDPVDGRTVYAAWLQNGKSDIAVARSDDFGDTWSTVIADSTNAGTDKPILAVRGPHVYVGYNHTQKVWVSSSHDGGRTFTSANVNPNANLGFSLAGGGAVDPAGNVYFSWAGYKRNGGATGPVNLYVSKSADGGATWTSIVLDVSQAPPDCSAYQCGWAYLGAQVVMAADEAGVLYALWNAGAVARGPERIYFSRSADGGATWSPRAQVSTAPEGAAHAFPAIAAVGSGDVRIAWMDARAGTLWNTYYRSSTNGGAAWSAETDVSTDVAGFSYIQPGGFSYPFGDYFEIDVDDHGDSHLIFGEGLNYQTPGSIWYVRGR